MATFVYQAYDAAGKARKGRIEALSAKEAREQLLAEGLFVRDLAAVGSGRNRTRGASALRQRGIVYRELQALLSAGLPMDRSLGLLAENPELKSMSRPLSAVLDEVREGQDFSASFTRHVAKVRDFETAVLEAGERSGQLASVCGELADVLEEEGRIQDQVESAMVYPLVVIVLSLAAVGILVGFLLPTFDKLLSAMDQELPWITQKVLDLGRVLRHPLGAAGTLLIIVVMGVGLRHFRQQREAWDRFRLRLPVVGAILASLARVRFARTLALLSEGGVPIAEGFRIAGRATGLSNVAKSAELEAVSIEQGGRVADAVKRIDVLNEDLPGWLQAAEAAGDIPGLLRHAARGHQRSWERKVAKGLAMLEPAILVGTGLFILLVALAILMPMLRLNQSIGSGA